MQNPDQVIIHPAPPGHPSSTACRIWLNGVEAPVLTVRVGPRDAESRWRMVDDVANSGKDFDTACFASFDMRGPVAVEIQAESPLECASVHPISAGIEASVDGRTLTFDLDRPRPLTIEFNGGPEGCLHLFANPPEENRPDPNDPDVIFFGPGVHDIDHLVVGDGQTLYVAGGALLRTHVSPEETPDPDLPHWFARLGSSIEMRGRGCAVRGRGIIDGSLCPPHTKNLFSVTGSDVTIEGVILMDSSHWTLPLRHAERVQIENIKIFGHRANSDGIGICNSRHVSVRGCFIRTFDDLVVVKTPDTAGPSSHIDVRDCVLWNEVAHALSIGAEIRADVHDVLFANCDVLHDFGREWILRVLHCDGGCVRDVRFSELRIEEARRLISLWVGETVWSSDKERGEIRDIAFENIRASGIPLTIEIQGFDADHRIDGVQMQNVVLEGNPLSRADVSTNAYVGNLRIENAG